MLVLIKGAGDLATGVACRLHSAGLSVVMTDLAAPTAVRRTVSFCQCVYDGTATVEGVTARQVPAEGAAEVLARGEIPVVIDPKAEILGKLPFDGLVDAILAKKNTGTSLGDAPAVIALGPGFTAGVDCHAVVETQRGHDLGRLILHGSAAPNTGVPGDVGGFTTARLIRAPATGVFTPLVQIGDRVTLGDPVCAVGDRVATAGLTGIVRGMLPPGIWVNSGMKSGDIDPRPVADHCRTVSDKARAIGGGALEGLLHVWQEEKRIWND